MSTASTVTTTVRWSTGSYSAGARRPSAEASVCLMRSSKLSETGIAPSAAETGSGLAILQYILATIGAAELNDEAALASAKSARRVSRDGVVLRIPAKNRLLDAAQMLAHPVDGELFVSQLERLEDGEVFLMVQLARGEDAEDEALLVGEQVVQHVEQLRQHRVARRAGDLSVEAHVHFVEHRVVVEVVPGHRQLPTHLDEILERGVLAGFGHRLRLERLTDADQIEQQLLRDAAGIVRAREQEHFFGARDVDAGAVANLHHADRLELLERFADGRMTDAESPRHLHDGRQAVAPLVVALVNHPADALRELVGQALLQHRTECVSHRAVSHRAIIAGSH